MFRINPDGTSFANFHNFTYGDGGNPYGVSAFSNVLYGTTAAGGTDGHGTVFRVNPDGTSFATLHHFSTMVSGTNSDGALPHAEVVASGHALYGVTWLGGPAGNGTVFRVNTEGSGFTNLHVFSAFTPDAATGAGTNADGGNPMSGLTLSGNNLYGTTGAGGQGWGILFRLQTDGTGFTNLYDFGDTDGNGPQESLLLTNNTLFGTTQGGGDNGAGTLFAVNPDGTGFDKLLDFSFSAGAYPQGSLAFSGKTLYGTAELGGIHGGGTVFALTLPPPNLSIQMKDARAILNWNNPAFALQAASTASGVFTNVPGATSPYTNLPGMSPKFFRLQ